jgi:hypothetical protein
MLHQIQKFTSKSLLTTENHYSTMSEKSTSGNQQRTIVITGGTGDNTVQGK